MGGTEYIFEEIMAIFSPKFVEHYKHIDPKQLNQLHAQEI